MYTNYPYRNSNQYSNVTYSNDDERFFLAPFLFGGLAGTALGYGIANNNQINNHGYYPMMPVYPIYPVYPSSTVYPTYSNTNYYY